MKKQKKRLDIFTSVVILIIIILVTLSIIIVLLPGEPLPSGKITKNPPYFHEFSGNVLSWNGDSVGEGVLVLANVTHEGTDIITTTTTNSDGSYHLFVKGYPGDKIVFYINDKNVSEYAYSFGSTTKQDLVTSRVPISARSREFIGPEGSRGVERVDMLDRDLTPPSNYTNETEEIPESNISNRAVGNVL